MRGWGHPYSSLPVRPACLLNSCSLVPSTKKRDEETSSTLAPHPNTALGGPRGFGLDQNQSHATPAWPGSWGSHCRDAEGGRGVGSDGGGEGATRGDQPKAAAAPKLHRQMRRPIDTEPGCIDVQQPDRHMGSRRHSSAPHRRANWVRCVTGAGRHLMSSSPRAGGKERDKGGVSTASSKTFTIEIGIVAIDVSIHVPRSQDSGKSSRPNAISGPGWNLELVAKATQARNETRALGCGTIPADETSRKPRDLGRRGVRGHRRQQGHRFRAPVSGQQRLASPRRRTTALSSAVAPPMQRHRRPVRPVAAINPLTLCPLTL